MADTIEIKLLTIQEAAQFLGLKKQTLYNRCAPKAQNPFPVKPKRIGGRTLRFDKRDLDKYIDTL